MLQKSLIALAISASLIAPARAAAPEDVELEEISVVGSGQTRSVSTLLPANLDLLPQGTSVQKALNFLPGVNAQAIDALAVNEQSLSISVRGFNGTHLGYTLDGVPLGDGAFNNYNGLSISRALISENLARADLAMGIANLGLASTSNTGGAITYETSDPASTLGVRANQTLGEQNTQRSFLRIDTGEYAGLSAYVSGMYSKQDLFVDQPAYNWSTGKQINAKLQYRAANFTLTAFADISRTNQADDFYLSKDAIRRLGWDWGGYAPDWATAVSRAYCTVTPRTPAAIAGCNNTGIDKAAEAYGFTGGQILRDDDLYYLAADFSITDALSAHAQVYQHKDKGAGNVWNHGWSSGNTVPWIIRNTGYSIDRHGALGSLAWDVGFNHLQAGFWIEKNDSSAVRYQYTQVTGPVSLAHYLQEQPDAGVFAQETQWDTKQFHLQDSVHLFDDALVIDAGFKSTNAIEEATPVAGIAKTPILPTSSAQFARGSLRAKDGFLPQVGARWRVAPGHEVYASYAQNIAMFQGGFKLGPMAVSQAVWDSQGEPLQPESSNAREVGYRFIADAVQATLALYDVSFGHRLLQYNPCNSRAPNGPGCGNRFYNVGGVKSRGVEAGLLWKPASWLTWYNSASFNKSTYNDDYVQADVLYRTGGKQQVDTPKQMFASVLTLRHGGLYGSLQGKFTGRRYYTYTNDQSFGGFTTFDLGAGYDFGEALGLKNMKLALNVSNLGNKRTVSNFDNSVFAPVDAAGTIVVAHANAPRQVFGTLSLAF